MTITSESSHPDVQKPMAGRPILQLQDVTYYRPKSSRPVFAKADLSVRAGEVVMLHIDPAQRARSTVSMLQGLKPPGSGRVLFEQMAWEEQSYDQQYKMRSQIGRIFERNGWIENQNVVENVLLASRHHGLPEDETKGRLDAMIERLELKRLTYDRPGLVDPPLLQLYQWIRALIHVPKLLLLERPLSSIPKTHIGTLIDMLREHCSQGAAVLWLTSNDGDAYRLATLNCRRFTTHNGALQPIDSDPDRGNDKRLAKPPKEVS